MARMPLDLHTMTAFLRDAVMRGELSESQEDEIGRKMGRVVRNAMSLNDLEQSDAASAAVDRHALQCGLEALRQINPTLWIALIRLDRQERNNGK